MNPLLNFYLDDNRFPFTITDVITGTDEWLETCHGHIQWTFPLETPSLFVNAPIITREFVELFQHSGVLQHYMYNAYGRMLQFYGLTDQVYNENIVKRWVTPRNHNFLRLTRMIRSLKIHMPNWHLWESLYEKLESVATDPTFRAIIGEETLKYWNDAYVESFDSSCLSSS